MNEQKQATGQNYVWKRPNLNV